MVVLYALAFNAISYTGSTFSYSSLLHDNSDNLLFIILMISLRIFGGWLNFVFIFFAFLNKKNFAVTRSKVTSKKTASNRFFSMVIDSPLFLIKEMMFFLTLFGAGLLLLLIAASLSSLFSATFSYQIKLHNLSRQYKPTSSQISTETRTMDPSFQVNLSPGIGT